MRIGNRFNIKCANITSKNGMYLPWVTEIRYLGIYRPIVSSSKFKCSLDYAKRAFYRSANSLLGKVANAASEEATLHLVNSKCLPILLYGFEACPLNKSEINSIDFTATRFFMKTFRSSNSNLINECMLFFGVEFPSVNLQKRTTNFVARYVTCENGLCQLVSKFILKTM